MDNKFFINAIKEFRDQSADAVIDNLEDPPGRKPRKKDVELSQFYCSLTQEQKKKIEDIIKESIDMTLFSFFCILDHVHFIEDMGEKSRFELYAIKDNEKTLINDPEDEPLHDMYNGLVLEENYADPYNSDH